DGIVEHGDPCNVAHILVEDRKVSRLRLKRNDVGSREFLLEPKGRDSDIRASINDDGNAAGLDDIAIASLDAGLDGRRNADIILVTAKHLPYDFNVAFARAKVHGSDAGQFDAGHRGAGNQRSITQEKSGAERQNVGNIVSDTIEK